MSSLISTFYIDTKKGARTRDHPYPDNIPDTVSRGARVQIREQTYKGSFVTDNIPDTVSRGATVQIREQMYKGSSVPRQYPG